MDWKSLGDAVVGAFVGGALTGGGAYVTLGRVVTRMSAKIDGIKENCAKCEGEWRMEVRALRSAVTEHHEHGPHMHPDWKDLFEAGMQEIRDRLTNIEGFLRSGSKSR